MMKNEDHPDWVEQRIAVAWNRGVEAGYRTGLRAAVGVLDLFTHYMFVALAFMFHN